MLKSGIRAAVLVLSMVFFVGCSDSATPLSLGTTPESIIEGIWVGQANVTGGTMAPMGRTIDLVMTMSQIGNGVTGELLNEDGSESNLAGTVEGQSFKFSLTQGKPCAGTFSGSGTAMNGDTELIGSYSGTDCHGSISAEFKTAIKEQRKPSSIHEIAPR